MHDETSAGCHSFACAGLMVFQTDNSPGFYYNSGNSTTPNWILVGSSGGWKLNGNAGTNPAIYFLGTTDNQPLKFKVTNSHAGIIDPVNNNTGFGKQALAQLTSGSSNTAYGSSVLANVLTGHDNSALGYLCGNLDGLGSENVELGVNSLQYNTSGTVNTSAG